MNDYSIYLHGQAICELSFSFLMIDTITQQSIMNSLKIYPFCNTLLMLP